MAQTVMFTYPLDQPRMIRPGVKLREADAPGNASWLAVPPSNPDRARQGDLSMDPIANFDSRPSLEMSGAPYTLKR